MNDAGLPMGAARFVVRDMGNSVDRIELIELITVGDASLECSLGGRCPLPATSRLLDLCANALGLDGSRFAPLGCVRAVDDRVWEVICWLV